MGGCIMLKRSEIEGIYYSNNTGRIFEAISDGYGKIIIRYCDSNQPEFGPCLEEDKFRLQHFIDIYEVLINYSNEGI